MRKRLRFGLVIGVIVVVLAIIAFTGGRQFIKADSSLPGSNCNGGTAFISITISHEDLSSSLPSFSPGICYTYTITNNDTQADDLLIQDPSNQTILAAVTNIAPGGTATLNYEFAPANSQTPVDFITSASGTTTPLGTLHLFLAQ